jgi:CHAT domain-containing protein
MDEQRIQAYVNLIEQLLICRQEQEETILQVNEELIDKAMLDEMESYAAYLERNEDHEPAEWLRELSKQLMVDLIQKTLDERQFLRETLILIYKNREHPQLVYSVWEGQSEEFNSTLLKALPLVADQLLNKDQPQRIVMAALFVNFSALIQQFSRGTRWINLELGIVACEQALRVYTMEIFPEQWASTMNNLALAYSVRIKGKKSENIEQSIDVYKQILEASKKQNTSLKWAEIMGNLALAYIERIRGSRSENIEQSINIYQEILTVIVKDEKPVEWASAMNNMALAYSEYIRGDRAENIEQSIRIYQEVLTVIKQNERPFQWASTMNNLANSYRDRIRGNLVRNIEKSICIYQKVLTVRTQDEMPGEWAATMMDLANSYFHRLKGNPEDNIEQAIAVHQKFLGVIIEKDNPRMWANSMNNLASAYSKRMQGSKTQNIEDAINAYQKSLSVITQTEFPINWAITMSNLAAAYKNRIEGDKVENVEAMIKSYQASLSVFDPEFLPVYCRKTARNFANFYSEQQRWDESVDVYDKALQAANILYEGANLPDSKITELTEVADLPLRAAYAYARTTNLTKAVETLEQNRARSLSESLDRDRTNLDQLKEKNVILHTQYKDITQKIRDLEAQQRDLISSNSRNSITPEALRNEATRLRAELTTTLDDIRQQQGYETFLTLPTFEDVRNAATSDCPLIYLITTPSGSLALTVTPDTVEPLWLDAFNTTQLNALLKQTWFSAYNQSHTNRQGWFDAIDAVTHQLWDPLMGPIVQQIQELGFGHITLIPTGHLSLLPLHAAWTPDPTKPTGRRYALDDIHITYAPNAKSLTAAQAIANRIQSNQILAIDNPTGDLPNAQCEIDCAIASFPHHTVLRHQQATIETVKIGLKTATIAHFSCHGTANLSTPLNSGLLMSDGFLTLKDILALNLAETGGLRLAILSACETGMIGLKNADEAISLPTCLLQAGFAGVVASLWSVNDLSTMLLLTKFYDLWRKDGLPPDQALRQAQIWLRDSTDGEKEDYFPDFFTLDGEARSYAHQYHWSAFSYVGI